MKRIIILICFASLISCKSDKKEQVIEPSDANTIIKNNDIEGNMYFEVIMNVVVLRDDIFHVFYKDFNDEGYSAEKVIEVDVKGKKDNQQLVFALPEDIIPNGLRLDFGTNYGQDPIKLNTLKIRFDKNEFVFDDGKFEQLFKPNKFVVYGESDQEIITEPIDGAYDPNFVSINLEDITFSLMD